MKIHYNKEFNSFETTECHKTDNIELDGVQLIPITELEKIKAELYNKSFSYSLTENFENDIVIGVITVSDMEKILDKHISEMKKETTNPKGVLEQIAEKQKTLLDTTKAWSDYIEKHGDIY